MRTKIGPHAPARLVLRAQVDKHVKLMRILEWLEDLAEHLKAMGKDTMLRDLLARNDKKERRRVARPKLVPTTTSP